MHVVTSFLGHWAKANMPTMAKKKVQWIEKQVASVVRNEMDITRYAELSFLALHDLSDQHMQT